MLSAQVGSALMTWGSAGASALNSLYGRYG
jgi:hypothetical protein